MLNLSFKAVKFKRSNYRFSTGFDNLDQLLRVKTQHDTNEQFGTTKCSEC